MSSKVGTSDTSSVELHKRERTQYMGHPGICTVTFCSGDPQTTFSSLKAKTLEVLTANPWIGGTFDKKKDLVFSSSPTSEDCDSIVSICKNAKVNRALPYPRLVAAVAKDASMSVGTGGALRSSGARITKLVVVEPEAAGGEFAIVFSMSHAAADGHDYYRIFNMICSTDPVDSLTPVRVAEYERRESEWTGKKVGLDNPERSSPLPPQKSAPLAERACFRRKSFRARFVRSLSSPLPPQKRAPLRTR